MKTKFLSSLYYIVLTASLIPGAHAQGTAFAYQGRLNDGGAPANGSYDLAFAAFITDSGGTPVAGPVTNASVAVSNGLFTTTVDLGQPTGDAVWLEIAVRPNGSGAFATLSPRQAVLPTPYAMFANTASNSATLGGQSPGAYVAKSGDTMTGALHLPANGLLVGSGQLALANGKVGIGTTSPGERLDLGENGNVRIAANPGNDLTPGNVCYELAARAAGGGEIGWRIWTAAAGGGYGVPPNSFSVWQYPPSGEPSAFQRFTILPTPAGGGADPVIIDPYGNVGIGTPNPTAKLDVFDGSYHLRFSGDAIEFSAGDSPGYVYCSDPGGRIDFVTGGRVPQDSNASLLLLANLNAIFNGSVGIGTLAPTAKLEVAGTVKATAFQGDGSGLTGLANATGWSLTGNSGTVPGMNFLGTTDNQPLEFKVNNLRGLRLEPTARNTVNVIGGSASNSVGAGVVGATIGGGGSGIYQFSAYPNRVEANFGTVSGGAKNTIQANAASATIGGGDQNTIQTNAYAATVGGGQYNTIQTNASYASIAGGQGNLIAGGSGAATIAGGSGHVIGPDAWYGSIGGGWENQVLGPYGAIPGGQLNECGGYYSFAAGYRAKARHTGSFVWADSTETNSVSTGPDQFCIRARGGVQLSDSTPDISFGTTTRQMLNLWGSQYGIGVQEWTTYFRTDEFPQNGFAWYQGGSHTNAQQNPGPGGKTLMTLDGNGLVVNGTARVCVLQITGGCDVAEPFELSHQDIPKGAVVVIDDEHPGRLKMSDRAYDTRVAGIISGANGIQPGLTLSQQGVTDGGQNVALSGRVYVQADATNVPIKPGDLLTTSDVPGHAMKVTNHAQAQGAILGKAMSGLKEGRGMVLVLVSLQ